VCACVRVFVCVCVCVCVTHTGERAGGTMAGKAGPCHDNREEHTHTHSLSHTHTRGEGSDDEVDMRPYTPPIEEGDIGEGETEKTKGRQGKGERDLSMGEKEAKSRNASESENEIVVSPGEGGEGVLGGGGAGYKGGEGRGNMGRGRREIREGRLERMPKRGGLYHRGIEIHTDSSAIEYRGRIRRLDQVAICFLEFFKGLEFRVSVSGG
jgi:hypothetical protein